MSPNINDLIQFEINRFRGETDAAYIDPDEVNPGACEQLINLTPFRKVGSVVQTGSTKVYPIAGVNQYTSNLPNPGLGYKLIDSHIFGVDRNSTTLTILFFKHDTTNAVRIYINPYYNPGQGYSNQIYYARGDAGWVSEWTELTETYHTKIDGHPQGNKLTCLDTISARYKYLAGFFIVNTDLPFWDESKFQFITDFDQTTQECTIQGNISSWKDLDSISVYRFPVVYFYKSDTESPIANDGAIFDAVPTDFHYSDGQLRIACGKDNRALSLTMIHKQKYFFGDFYEGSASGGITQVVVNTSDTNLIAKPTVAFSGGGGSSATCEVEYLRMGDFTIHNPGAAHYIGEIVKAEGSANIIVNPLFEVTGIDGGGGITSMVVVNSGLFTNVAINPLDINGFEIGGGTDSPNAQINIKYAVQSIKITNTGSGYTSAPSVVFTPPGVATATASIYEPDTNIDTTMAFDGLWFDFAQPIQVLRNSAVSGWYPAQSGGASAQFWLTPSGKFQATAPVSGILMTKITGVSRNVKSYIVNSAAGNGPNLDQYEKVIDKFLYIEKSTKNLNWLSYAYAGVNIITITDPGSGYEPWQELDVTFTAPQPGGTMPKYKAVANGNGNIYAILPVTNYPYRGSGYNSAPTITIPPPSAGVQATANCTIINPVQYDLSYIISKLESSSINNEFTWSLVGANIQSTIPNETSSTNVIFSGNTFLGQDADANVESFNKFLGCKVKVTPVHTTNIDVVENVERTVFILSVITDKRNETVISHGPIRPSGAGTLTIDNDPDPDTTFQGNWGMELRFNRWFNRRITGISYYNKSLNTAQDTIGNLNTLSKLESAHPFFSYAKKYIDDAGAEKSWDINEVPLMAQYDIYEFGAWKFGSLPPEMKNITNLKDGINAYSYHNNGYWFVKFKNEYNGISASGKQLTFINNLGRYISYDTTMNYTRICQLGQTNGRFFISGCKNSVEKETFDSNDMILYNILGAGVSNYDIFTRDNIINVGSGNSDEVSTLITYDGYITVIKGYNVFTVDVSTDDDLEYRVIKTYIGRGCLGPNAVCETPQGIVMLSKDGVYLISPRGSKSLLREDNGRLDFYRTNMAINGVVNAIYYSDYNELLLVQTNNSTCNVMVYSFNADAWHSLKFNQNVIRCCVAPDRKIVFFNWESLTRYNIAYYTDITYHKYLLTTNVEGAVDWSITTHNVPYIPGDRYILPQWLQLAYDSKTGASSKNIYFLLTRSDGASFDSRILTTAVNATLKRQLEFYEYLSQLEATGRLKITLTNNNGEGDVSNHEYFSINSLTIWGTKQTEQFRQTRS